MVPNLASLFLLYSGLTSNNLSTWSSISRCCPVTQTIVLKSSECFQNSFTSGHILMAFGRVPKTSITFFIIVYRYCLFRLFCQHQRTDGVIHHRLVIDGQQLFAYTLGNRVKPRAGASGEYYSFHKFTLFIYALSAALGIVKASFTLLSLARQFILSCLYNSL